MASLLPLLVLALCFFSISSGVFISIDCGSSSDSYTDENSIPWSGDDMYTASGESRLVQPTNSVSHVMDSLRVFITRKKNCYSSIKVGKGKCILIRASFYYGNYDGRSQPPIFDLHFDGNHWTMVQTSNREYVYYEVIYVTKSDMLSVCVSQIKDGDFPFISALEVRGLEDHMYSSIDSNYPLFLATRHAYGAKETIRYTDDLYDRIWAPVKVGSGLTSVTSDAFLEAFKIADDPPPAILHNAITGLKTSTILQFNLGFPIEAQVYLNMYFSEVFQLEADQLRSFKVYKDNISFSDPVIPPYGNFTELYVSNLTVSPNTTFSLVPTTNSTLPPLINALEVFRVGEALADGTNSKDVAGLRSLQDAFEVLQGWSGDPCLPHPYSWDWINCTSHPTPHVTALYLGSFGLSGQIPDFGTMDALEIIDFHNNSLDGEIPNFLGTLPKLKQLNLANNELSGVVPASLSEKNDLNLNLTGNSKLCISGESSCQMTSSKNSTVKTKHLPMILGIAIPASVVIWVAVGVFIILRFKRKTTEIVALTPGRENGQQKTEGKMDGGERAHSEHGGASHVGAFERP